MRLFARIVSHGFAAAVVVLLALGLVYRGELFTGMELPSFLAFEPSTAPESSDTGGQVSRGIVGSVVDADRAARHTGKPVADVVPPAPGAPAGDLAGAVDDAASAAAPLMAEMADVDAASDSEAGAIDAATPKADAVDEDVVDVTRGAPATAAAEAGSADSAAPVPLDQAGGDAAAAVETEVPAPAIEAGAAGTAAPMADLFVEDTQGATQGAPPAAAAAGDSAPVMTDRTEESVAAAVEMEVPAPAIEAGATGVAAPKTDAADEGAGDVTGTAAADKVAGTDASAVEQVAVVTPSTKQVQAGMAATAAAAPDAGGSAAKGTSPYRLLAAAREAYWLRDYTRAEALYRDLIGMQPDNPDGYGELGNMYFSQGKWELASTAYYEAGSRLADEGLYDQARELVEVLKGLQQNRQADDLARYISGKSQTTP